MGNLPKWMSQARTKNWDELLTVKCNPSSQDCFYRVHRDDSICLKDCGYESSVFDCSCLTEEIKQELKATGDILIKISRSKIKIYNFAEGLSVSIVCYANHCEVLHDFVKNPKLRKAA